MIRFCTISSPGSLPKALDSLMRLLSLCPHANVGWPIRTGGNKVPLQHCSDCGAQRTYILQPNLQIGRWERPQKYAACPLQASFSSNMANGLDPRRWQRSLNEQRSRNPKTEIGTTEVRKYMGAERIQA